MHSLFWPISDIVCGAQMITGFFLGATFAINGQISVGSYLAYAGMLIWIIWPMRNLGRLIVQLSTGMVSFGRVLEIIKQVREPLDEGTAIIPNKLNGELLFQNICFKYEEGEHVLEDINVHSEGKKRGVPKKAYKLKFEDLARAWFFVEAHVDNTMKNYRNTIEHIQKLVQEEKETE